MRTIAVSLTAAVLLMTSCGPATDRSAQAQMTREGAAREHSADSRHVVADVSLRRIWSGASDQLAYASSPSPNGRYLTEIDWSSGDLAVRDLGTGELHRLTQKGSWDTSGDMAEVSRFSPDGRRVAYIWYNRQADNYEVRVLDFAVDADGIPQGSNPRVVYRWGELQAYWLFGWSPSDEILTGIYRPDGTVALGFLSIATGSIQIVKSFDWRDVHAALSRDGRYIAYDRASGPDPLDRDIHILAADGSWEATVRDGPGIDVVLGWDPTGGALLFHSEESGRAAVWRLPIAEGRPVGEAAIVRDDVRAVLPLEFVGDALYFGVQVENSHYRVASIDFTRKQIISLETTFDAPAGHMIRMLAWSPDGEYVMHDDAGLRAELGTDVYLRTADGEVLKTWRFDIDIRRWFMQWAPDGKSVFFPAIDRQNRGAIFRLDLQRGELDMVRRFYPPQSSGRVFSLSPDGKKLYFARAGLRDGEPVDDSVDVVAHDLATGTEHPIHRVAHVGPVVVSPDGEWLAYFDRVRSDGTTLELFPVAGGESRTLHHIEEGRLGIVGWTPDSQELLFSVRAPFSDDSAVVAEVWKVSREGGDGEFIARLPEAASGTSARLHPDGRTIAYRAGRLWVELWALDGLTSSNATDTDESTNVTKGQTAR